jgi:hypothetical protein
MDVNRQIGEDGPRIGISHSHIVEANRPHLTNFEKSHVQRSLFIDAVSRDPQRVSESHHLFPHPKSILRYHQFFVSISARAIRSVTAVTSF